MARYLQLKLVRAENINACTATKSETIVMAKASYKNTVYTTTKVKGMGRMPAFEDDGTNVLHFVYENETEYITLELFNRNDASIGKSILYFHELTKLIPEQAPEEKVLKVIVTRLGYQRQCGELFLTAQIKQQQAMGEQGNLTVKLKNGDIQGLTSFSSKTTKVRAKLIYNHTTLTSGILEGTGNKFVWYKENSFTFVINSSRPEDELEIEVYNGSTKAGECKIKISLFKTGEGTVSLKKVELLLKKKAVGFIDVDATFICRRNNSFPSENSTPTVGQPAFYPSQHQAIYRQHPHMSQPMYAGVMYPPEQHPVQTIPSHLHQPAPGPYAPSAPPVHHPAMQVNPNLQTQAVHPAMQFNPNLQTQAVHPAMQFNPNLQTQAVHPAMQFNPNLQTQAVGGPPGRSYFENDPIVRDFINGYH